LLNPGRDKANDTGERLIPYKTLFPDCGYFIGDDKDQNEIQNAQNSDEVEIRK